MQTKERSSKSVIEEFLGRKRIAAVGVSRDPKDFTRQLMKEFVERGYDIVPVNPAVTEMDGRKCYPSIGKIESPVSAALLLTSPSATDDVVRDCAEAGVEMVWMYRGGGTGAVSESAVKFCREHGIPIIAGECPYMFFPHTGLPHRIHGLIRKITGSYPR
jgi:predicted CoA-binding protein